MPKNAKKVVAKKATKKSTKKVAKKAVAKRTRAARTVTADIEATLRGQAVHAAVEAAVEAAAADIGQFSANGLLNLNVRDNVQAARGEVVFAIRNLVEASIELSNSASLSQSERDVATAAQRLAVARVELALGGLESAVRG